MKYRAEIDGLRTVAVLPVVLFHAGFSVFSGGFVGVDIFFVISGFLITTILIQELDEGRFSIINFYARRSRRILPALFAVVAATGVTSFFYLSPNDLESFAKSVIACMLFVSNILFWSETGYFDTNAEGKPLLHTWSLAVEEQYYMLFPILLYLLWRFRARTVVTLITLLALLSFAICIAAAANFPSANFYLIISRTWELLAGSICAFLAPRFGANQILAILGLALVAVSIFAINSTMPVPGWATLGPVLGASLIILFARSSTWVAQILSLRPIVWIGLISYSLYLWHQPVLVFARYEFGEHLGAGIAGGLVILSLVLATLTWKFVEQPFRGRDPYLASRRAIFTASGAGMALLIFLAAVVLLDHGRLGRVPAFYTALRASVQDSSSVNFSPDHDLIIGNKDNVTAALIGDSHANAMVGGLKFALEGRAEGILILSEAGCPPIRGLVRLDFGPRLPSPCDEHARLAFDRIMADPHITTVIVAFRFPLYLEGSRFDNGEGGIETGVTPAVLFDAIPYAGQVRPNADRASAIIAAFSADMKALSAAGKKIVMIYPIPEVGWDIMQYVWLHRHDANHDVSTSLVRYRERSAAAIAVLDQLAGTDWQIIRPADVLCNTFVKDRCAATVGTKSYYRDSNHLNNAGAGLLAPLIVRAIGDD